MTRHPRFPVRALPAMAAVATVLLLVSAQIAQGQLAPDQRRPGRWEDRINTAWEANGDLARANIFRGINGLPLGAQGGAELADFESLIDMILNTVRPDSWLEAGGVGTIEPFPSGVLVDADGLMRRIRQDGGQSLPRLREAAPQVSGDVRRASPLRKISLTRLERSVQMRLAAGQLPTEEMLSLAGLQRIQYVMVYPETGDLVIAGPAGDWRVGPEGRLVGVDNGRPVLRLDDLIVVLRQTMAAGSSRFGCLIVPKQDALAHVQQFVQQTSASPIPAARRGQWLEQLRSQLGRQDIQVYGIDPRTRVARVLVEADYRMKLVGMGLEEGVPGVVSYLDLIQVAPGEAPPPMGVLRWWFTLGGEGPIAAPDRLSFALDGPIVQVQSENERLTAEGKRVHTGESEKWNRQFAASFTKHFDELCDKYPVYAELRSIFEMAVACAILREEDLPGKVGWHLTCFGNPEEYPIERAAAPKSVQTVINHRVINRVHVVAGVSGGVRVDPSPLVTRASLRSDPASALPTRRTASTPPQLPREAWWWD